MMLVPHACASATVGSLIKRPAVALAVGLAGHAVLDLIPHKDIAAHKAEGAAVGLILSLVGSSCGFKSPAFWCAVGGVIPDVEQVLPWTDPKRGRRRYYPSHNRRLHSLPLPGAPEYRTSLRLQGLASAAALLFAISRCRRPN